MLGSGMGYAVLRLAVDGTYHRRGPAADPPIPPRRESPSTAKTGMRTSRAERRAKLQRIRQVGRSQVVSVLGITRLDLGPSQGLTSGLIRGRYNLPDLRTSVRALAPRQAE
jgi:hypothetical protein